MAWGKMADDVLSGLKIKSTQDIVDEAWEALGSAGRSHIDLGNALMRKRFKDALVSRLNLSIQLDVERAIEAGAKRAIEHVFRLMRDSEYQEKKKRRQHAAKERRAAKRAEKDAIDAKLESERRMASTASKLMDVKPPKPVLQ
jgi:hypothetical protein